MGDTLGFVSLYSHAWEWTISTIGLMTVRASSAHGTGKKKKSAFKQSQYKHVASAEDCSCCDKSDGCGGLYAKRAQARAIFEKIEPDWPMIRARVWTKQATGLPYDALHRRLFLHDWFAGQAVARSPSQWISTLYLHGLDQLDALSWQWLNQHENLVEQVWHWHTQQGTFRRKRPPDVRDDPMRGQ